MVLLHHVRKLKNNLLMTCQVCVFPITLKNLTLGKEPLILIFGTCRRNDEDFSRYGEGGFELIVCAMTLLVKGLAREAQQDRKHT